jgi:hypothetical protein
MVNMKIEQTGAASWWTKEQDSTKTNISSLLKTQLSQVFPWSQKATYISSTTCHGQHGRRTNRCGIMVARTSLTAA